MICWMDAGDSLEPEWAHFGDAEWAGGTIMNCGYRTRIETTVDEVWQPVSQIGGKIGWYFGNFLWHLRGIMDRPVGGVGLRRGRRHSVSTPMLQCRGLYLARCCPFYKHSIIATSFVAAIIYSGNYSMTNSTMDYRTDSIFQ